MKYNLFFSISLLLFVSCGGGGGGSSGVQSNKYIGKYYLEAKIERSSGSQDHLSWAVVIRENNTIDSITAIFPNSDPSATAKVYYNFGKYILDGDIFTITWNKETCPAETGNVEKYRVTGDPSDTLFFTSTDIEGSKTLPFRNANVYSISMDTQKWQEDTSCEYLNKIKAEAEAR
jgi:hypothetical protein